MEMHKMAYTPKPGSFTLFVNNRKTADNHPDRTGDGLDLDGNPIWVSGWLKKTDKGQFLSCSFKLKETGTGKPKSTTVQDDPLDDGSEIPF